LRFTQDEVKHWFLGRKDVIYTYVVEKDKNITDLISFYCLPSSILKHEKYNQLKAAYCFYNIATSVTWPELFEDALILANREGFDVFNALNIMDNEKAFSVMMRNK
jgi:glycylpeptide N-tetradecanoyltransferase